MKLQQQRVWVKPFLASLAQNGVVLIAAKHANISRKAAYELRKSDPEFAEAWSEALGQAAEAVEARMMEFALGQHEESNLTAEQVRLWKWMMTRLKPDRWGDNININHGGKVDVDVEHTVHRPDETMWRRIIEARIGDDE